MAPGVDMELAAARLAEYYETLDPATLARLGEYYAPDARFQDPFNEVVGVAAIARVFEHMFATVEAPRFRVTNRIVQGRQAMLGWDFTLRLGGRSLVVRGVSHLCFDADGRVVRHRDYWDPAAELYERLPLVGGPLRWLRRRFSAPAS